MKLREITGTQRLQEVLTDNDWLTGKEAFHWYNKYLSQDGQYVKDIGDPRGLHILGNVVVKHIPDGKIRVKIRLVEGDFDLGEHADTFTSLETLPEEITGSLDLWTANIRNLQNLPKLHGLLSIGYVHKLKKIEDIFPYITTPMNTVSMDGLMIPSLVGIADLIKHPISRINFSYAETIQGGLGLINVPGLKYLDIEHGEAGGDSAAFAIIQEYLGQPDRIFECQQRLIEIGHEHNAQL